MTETNTEIAPEVTTETDDAFFDNVIADIDKSASQENIPAEDDLNDDLEDGEQSEDESTDKATTDATPQIKRKNQNRAQERIQQVIAQRDLAESKHQATLERLQLANDQISLLKSQIESYEPIIKEFNDFKAAFMETGEIPDNLTKHSATVDAAKPLTAADLDRLLEERETKRRADEDKIKRKQELEEENQRILNMWKPHLKKLNDASYPEGQKKAFEQFVAPAKDDRQRRDLIKVLGKYDNAIEIAYGLSKKQGFDSLSFAEQLEMALKLNNKIIEHRQKTTQSKSTVVESKMHRDANRATSYDEYIKSKYGK
jgi:hypothetical protein